MSNDRRWSDDNVNPVELIKAEIERVRAKGLCRPSGTSTILQMMLLAQSRDPRTRQLARIYVNRECTIDRDRLARACLSQRNARRIPGASWLWYVNGELRCEVAGYPVVLRHGPASVWPKP